MLLRPFVFVFSRKEDPWNLKPVALLVMVPILILNLTESAPGDFVGLEGILFGLTWGAAEIYRLSIVEQEKAAQREALAEAPLAARGESR